MFFTYRSEDRKAGVPRQVTRWPAVDLLSSDPMFLVSWTSTSSGETTNGGTLLVRESDLRDWTGGVWDAEMTSLQMLHLSDSGQRWVARNVVRIFDGYADVLEAQALVFEGDDADRFTRWLCRSVPKIVEAEPLWDMRMVPE